MNHSSLWSAVDVIFYPILKKIKKYKNIHRGDSCYIMGDGSSLKWFDLECFTDLITIAVHKVGIHKQFNILNAHHLLMIDPFLTYPLMRPWGIPGVDRWDPKTIKSNSCRSLYREMIKENPKVNFVANITDYPALKPFHSNVTYVSNKFPGGLGNKLDYLKTISGSFRASISFAIYMGFHKIYLIGFDYTHSPNGESHWYEKGKGFNIHDRDYEKKFIDTAKECADIITVTLDGKSRNLKYIRYEDLTGKAPFFRENNQLVKKAKYLDMLSRMAVGGNSLDIFSITNPFHKEYLKNKGK